MTDLNRLTITQTMTKNQALNTTAYMDEKIVIKATELLEDIDTILLQRIKEKNEGRCGVHGYVYPGSIELITRSLGEAEHGKFTAEMLFTCRFKCKCFIPVANQVVTVKVIAMNKSGAIAVLLDSDGTQLEAAQIFCPRDLHLGSKEFDTLSVGTVLKIQLVRSRFQVNDPYIIVVGVLISN